MTEAVLVALVTVMGGIGIELIRTSRRAARAAQKAGARAEQAHEAIGSPNGQGNVVEMLERLLAGQTGQDARLARLEGQRAEDRERLGRMEGRLDQLESHVGITTKRRT